MRAHPVSWTLGIIVALMASTLVLTAVAWDSRTASLWQQLDRESVVAPARFSAADLEDLPAPVERFFLHVLLEGQPIIRAAEVITEGEFRTGAGADDWRRFTAWQRFSTNPPGFVWDARIQMAPFLPVHVRDAYVGGRTEMLGRILHVFPVLNERDSRELALGELHRYLAEAIWFPTALLPDYNPVTWQPIDTKSAVATLTDRGMSVSMRFLFSPAGDVREVFALDRMRSVNGRHEPTAWAVRCDQHEMRHGVRIPVSCESEWRLADGALPYWRGRVTNVGYELSR